MLARFRFHSLAVFTAALLSTAAGATAEEQSDHRPAIVILGRDMALCSCEGHESFAVQGEFTQALERTFVSLGRYRLVPSTQIPDSIRPLRRILDKHMTVDEYLHDIGTSVGAEVVIQLNAWTCNTGPSSREGARGIRGIMRAHYRLYSVPLQKTIDQDSIITGVSGNMYRSKPNLLSLAAGDTASQQFASVQAMREAHVSESAISVLRDLAEQIDKTLPMATRIAAITGRDEVIVTCGSGLGARKGMKFKVWPVAASGNAPDDCWATPSGDSIGEIELREVGDATSTAKVKKLAKGAQFATGDVLRLNTRKWDQ